MTRVAVVGHVEWAEFVRVDRMPSSGEIAHARDPFEAPAGGGSVAAVQMAKLAGSAVFFTALGDDALGARAASELRNLGLELHVALRAEPQRRVFVHLDESGERTITVIGPRMGPRGNDPLPWGSLRDCDAVYFTAGDAAALRAARAARVLVATARARETLATGKVPIDVLVASARDPGERVREGELDPPPAWIVRTEGASGGAFVGANGSQGRWKAVPPPGPIVDTYGAGDSFAGGLGFGLGAGLSLARALELAARCGAASLAGAGPYTTQLRRDGG